MAEFTGRRSGRLSDNSRRKMHAEQRFIDANREQLDREALARKAEREAVIDAFAALKRYREQQGLSLGEVAERSGIDKSYLSKLENDPYPNPTFSTLMRIAKAVGVKLTIDVSRPEAA